MQAHFKLKLLNGPLAGRTLQLPGGSFSIGGGDSDLSIPLEGGLTANFEVCEQQVLLTGNTPFWIDGERHSPGPLPLAVGIDLAGVHLVIDRPEVDIGAPKVRRRARPAIANRLAVVFAIALLIGLGWATFPNAPLPSLPTPQEWLPQALQGLPGLTAQWQGNDHLELSGRCRNSEQLIALTSRLRQAGVRINQQVTCDDDLQSAVQALLWGMGYTDATVSINADGTATIDGPIRSDASFASMAEALDRLPGLRGWHLTDQKADQFASLMQTLKEGQLVSGLSIQSSPEGWLLSGQLDASRQASVQKLIEGLDKNIKQQGHYRFFSAPSTADPAQFLPAPMSNVGGNSKSPYLELANGVRLQVGSTVKRGMTIVNIEPTGISLTDKHRLVFLPLQV